MAPSCRTWARLGEDWSATLSVTGLRARFSDAFISGTGAAAVTVPAGSRLAGTPNKSGFAELAWAPKGAWGGFNTAVEVVHTGVLYVNDVNEDYAPAVTVVNLRAGLSQKAGPWTFSQLVRVDNAERQGLCRLGDRERRQQALLRAGATAQLAAGCVCQVRMGMSRQ